MKKLLFIAILLIAGNTMFSQRIISSKDAQKEIEDLTYIIVRYDSNGGSRSETFVVNYMNKYGWKFVTFIPGNSQIEKLVFIRAERD